MTERKHRWDPASRRAWISAGAPILALVVVVAILFFALIANFAQRQDRAFAQDSTHLVESVLRGRSEALARLTLDYAMWNEAYEHITLRRDESWLEENYYSAVADALVVLRLDGSAHYQWQADGVRDGGAFISAAINASQNDVPPPAGDSANSDDLVTYSVISHDGRLALLAIAAVSQETAFERRTRGNAPVDYLAIIDVLDDREIAELGETLDLDDLAFTTAPASRDHLALGLQTPSARLVGALTWRNERPGSAAFALQFWPIMLCLLFIGVLAALVARRLVASHTRIASRAETALESSRLRAEFIATMSHELRTPLNAIIGYTELIQDQIGVPHDAEAMRTDTNHILGAAKHLRQLVSDILDHARIDSGRIALNIEAMPVNGLLEEIVEISEPLAMAQNTVLSITDPGKGLEVLADDGRLRQILINLVGNAIKFTKNGDIELSAQIDRRGDAIEFSVRDTGIGIAPDELARLFQPFVQANAEIQQKFGGTGLGLSISQKLARAMGGSISATSAPGKGSAFTLTLPLAAPAQRQAA